MHFEQEPEPISACYSSRYDLQKCWPDLNKKQQVLAEKLCPAGGIEPSRAVYKCQSHIYLFIGKIVNFPFFSTFWISLQIF